MNPDITNTSKNNPKKGKVIRVPLLDDKDYGFRFVPNDDSSTQLRLTEIRMMVAEDPLGPPNEINLARFEGKEITVQGDFNSDIVYDASIIYESDISKN